MEEKLLSRAEVAGILNVSLRTVDRLRTEGALPAIKVRTSVRFRSDDVRRLIGFLSETNTSSFLPAGQGAENSSLGRPWLS